MASAIEGLNPEQKKAVIHGEGPLLIIAGAGTGKTTVITRRIQHLILEKKVKPDDILALTFTEKAATEMEERVDKIMPYGYSQMWIATFHSFCDRILRDESIHIGLAPNYKLMSEAESIMFLRKNLFNLPLKYFRPLGNPTKFLESMMQHFSRLNDEDISGEEYVAYAKSLEKEKDTKDITPEEELEIQKTLEIALCYKQYEESKLKEGVLDFSNLITMTLKLFRTRPNILKKYQDQFKYVLVDEFQDTNYSQNELAILLAGKGKNITVVADDDQAIYRWRGAALSNVIQFKNNFPEGEIITLNRNYRSTQEILDHSYQLIQFNNPNRLEALENIDKHLTSERKQKGKAIELIYADRVDQEAEQIVKKIDSIIKSGKYTYSDIAILVRANNHATTITQALTRLQIPYQFLGPGQLFLREEIKNLIAYLKVLYNIDDSVSLFRVLQMEIFEFSMREISSLLSICRKKNLTLFESMENIDDAYLTPETKAKVKKVTTMILRHLERARKDTAGQILYYFLIDTGLFNKYLSVATEKEEQIALNIAKFFDRIKTFETINQEATVYTVVDWIDLMMQMGDSPLVSEVDWKNINAVNILTIHSSKGLEFPVVFMVNLVADRFPTRERKEKLPVPANLVKEILPDGDFHVQEERRLFYVGMTRAKDLLFFTAAKFYAEGKREKKISQFVYEALPELHDQQKLEKSKPLQLSLIDVTREYEEARKDKLSEENPPLKLSYLSYSALQAFDICPLHYRARYILNLPAPFAAPLSYGLSIHATLKDLYETLRHGEPPTEKTFLELLRKNWISEGYQDKAYEKEMYTQGEKIIKQYFENYFNPKFVPLALEMPFSFHIEDIRITGRIDRIDSDGNGGIEIIDYKTGPSDGISKSAYETQLAIYALAATKLNGTIRRDLEHIKATLFYVEDGKKFSQKVTPEALQNVDDMIRKKIKEIEKSDFKCSKSILCKNCEYRMLCNPEN